MKVIWCIVWLSIGSITSLSCNDPVKTGIYQSSYDINDSKGKDVFVKQYIPEQSNVKLKGWEVRIEQVWIEHIWEYKNQAREIKIREGICGYVKLNSIDDIYNTEFIYNGKISGIQGGKLTFNPDLKADTIIFIFYENSDTSRLKLYAKTE